MSLLALQQDFRRWLVEEAPEAAQRIARPDAPGLGVYLNNYRGQLMSCLAQSFEATRAWLGEAAFDGAAATHIDRLPPHDWTIDAYALHLPDTLDLLYPDDPEVGDLARLERDLGLAFVGEDCPPLDLSALAGVDWDSAAIHLVPTFTLVPVRSNAAAIWSAIRAEEAPPAAEILPEPAHLALWRAGFSPSFRTLEADEATGLRAISGGATFAALCQSLAERMGEEAGPALAGAWLGQWIGDGMVAAIG